MEFIDKIINRAKENKKTIILPESLDERILKAAVYVSQNDIANIILLGNKEQILKKAGELSLIFNENINIIDYKSLKYKDEYEKYVLSLYNLRKEKGLSLDDARKLLQDEIYFANILLKENVADGIVAGAVRTTSNVIRPALQIIKTKKESKIISSYFLIDTKLKEYGEEGILFMSDCGLNIDPDSEELSCIAIDSSKTFEKIFEKKPKVAFLSFSSFKSAESESTKKIQKAVKLTKEKNPNLICSGEMQLDTAISKKVAMKKAPNDIVSGNANVLIFPNLDSGNIGYKMAQYMSKGKAYGPLLQGINKPINDLSRGASVEEIIGVIAITAIS